MKQVPKELQDKILCLMEEYNEELIIHFGTGKSVLIYGYTDVFKLPDENLIISFWPNCELNPYGIRGEYNTVSITYNNTRFNYKLSHNIMCKIKEIKKQVKLRNKIEQIRIEEEYNNKERQMLKL